MTETQATGNEQAALWNGVAGNAWVDAQDVVERMFRPIETLLVDAVVAESAHRILDVGCGTGATTLAIARRLGVDGQCTGVDISEPMLAAARRRAERDGLRSRFICADAQTHAFEPASFDMIVSRFGVMFFEDPVQAFANLRRAARPGAALRMIVWRGPDENPFMTTAERAAAGLLPLPPRVPDAPGQFAFADRLRVRAILERGGWNDVDIQVLDLPCTLPESELVGFFTRLGPLGRVLNTVDARTQAHIIETVRAAFAPYVEAGEVRFNAACWSVAGRASA